MTEQQVERLLKVLERIAAALEKREGKSIFEQVFGK